jgi:Tol biopolymer transport system component
LLVTGPYRGDGDVDSEGLLAMPAREGGASVASMILKGAVYEPAWHPDGNRIAFAMSEGGNRPIYTINRDGSDRKKVTSEGRFGHPKFSPKS